MNCSFIPAVVGPTGIGKSRFAADLARRIGGEIVSCDSRLVYRGMDIGTAKPSAEELREIHHHCINIIDPSEEYSAGRWAFDADSAVRDILSRGKVPVICGGTFFYLSALRSGFDISAQPDQAFRAEMLSRETAEGAGTLHRDLLAIHPERADQIHPHDLYRIIRALQIARDGSSEAVRENPVQFRLIELRSDRQKLYERINSRVDEMVKCGLFEEFQSLLKQGFDSSSPGLKSVGYFEFFNYIEARCSFAESVEQIKQNSRKYAKRQLTWLRNRETPHYFAEIESSDDLLTMLADSLYE